MEEGKKPSAQDKPEKPASGPSKKSASRKKKPLMVLLALLVFLLIGGLAFWQGTQRREGEGEEPVATESADLADEQEAAPSPTLSPTEGEAPTPTPTSTPTPTPTPTPAPVTKTFDSSDTIDGFRSSNAGGNSGLDIRTGRNVNLITRGFASFGIGDIPDGATIEKAVLRLYQANIIGNPYGAGIRVMVDHLDYGDTLEHADYAAPSISASFATLSTNANLEWKEVDVTDAVRNDMENNRERSQFRTHLAVENIGGDVQGDFAYFESADNSQGTGNTPKLVVTYTE